MTEEKSGCEENLISDEELLRVNPGGKPLTVENLRSYKGMENISDDEAQEIIFTLQTFCTIVLEAIKAEENAIEQNTNQHKIAA